MLKMMYIIYVQKKMFIIAQIASKYAVLFLLSYRALQWTLLYFNNDKELQVKTKGIANVAKRDRPC